MDAVHLVDDVAQQVAALHAVVDAAEDGGDHVAAVVAVGAGELAQVGEEARTTGAVGPGALVLIDEGEQLVAGDAVGPRRPVAPAVGRFDGRPEQAPREGRLLLALPLQVVQELEEHDPGEQWAGGRGRR